MGIVTNPNDPDVVVHHYDRKELQDTGENPRIFDGDTIQVPNAEMYNINGEVKNGGPKVWKPGTTLLDAIADAGGLTDKGAIGRSVIKRMDPVKKKIIEVKKLKEETPVLPKDIIIINKRLF